MVQYGVMEIVYGAIISVWHEEQVINLTYLLICTLTKAELATLNIKIWPIHFTCCRIQQQLSYDSYNSWTLWDSTFLPYSVWNWKYVLFSERIRKTLRRGGQKSLYSLSFFKESKSKETKPFLSSTYFYYIFMKKHVLSYHRFLMLPKIRARTSCINFAVSIAEWIVLFWFFFLY